MDSKYDSALVALESEMKLNLSVEGMIPLLERDAGGFMIKAEKMQVTSVNRENTPEMVSRIVSILRKKGNEQFFSFLDILDKSGNEVWANKLRAHVGLPQRFPIKKNKDPNKLTIRALMPYIGELASLGLQISGWLDMSNEWAAISKTPGTPGEHLQQLLTDWLNGEENPKVPHNWDFFIDVVRKCKRGKLAERMEREVFGSGGFDSEAFMDKFSERFLNDVDSRVIVLRLEINEVIPEDVAHDIDHCSVRKGNEKLLLHLQKHANPNSISKLCDVMRSITGYPRMNRLGRAMKKELDLLTVEEYQVSPQQLTEGQDRPTMDMTPSDIGLQGVLEMCPPWHQYAISLGLSIGRLMCYLEHPQKASRGLFALQYWRDGQCGSGYPTTWKFLLDVIKDRLGPIMADDLEKLIITNDTWTLTSPRATSSVQEPPSTSAGDTSPSQHLQSLEFYNMRPSDIGLQGILDMRGLHFVELAIFLGVPMEWVKYYEEQHQYNVAGLLALQHWRDGRVESSYPSTWKFLLEAINQRSKFSLAEELKKKIITHNTWTLTDPRATSSVQEPPSTSAGDTSPSQHPQSLEFYNMSPSDIGLKRILEKCPRWYKYAISLGLTIDRMMYYIKQHQVNIRGLLALHYWKDGRCGSRYPPTWKFLLDVIRDRRGPNVAKDLEKLIITNDTWTLPNPLVISSVPQPPSTSAQDTSPSQHLQSLEFYNMSPSDIGLQGILDQWPLWDKYAIYLGLTSDRIKYYYEQRLGITGELLALKYWRDGRCGSRYPPTWKFLLDVIRDCGEPKVAEDLEKLIITYDTWTLTSPRDLFGDEFEEVIKSHACIELTITKCTTIGPPRVGKTCLKHLLTGKKWDVKKEMTPTPAIRAPEWVERYRGESKHLGMNWSRFTPEERIQALYQSIAQKEYEENVASNQPDESQDMQADVLSTHKGHSPKEMDVQTPSLVLEVHSMDSDEDPNEVMQSSVQEDVQMLEMELEELNIPVGLQQTKGKEGRILHKMEILHFIDTGGQDIYHDVHPVLITSPSVYLVVFNLQDCFPPKLKADFLTSDLTQRALRSIHTLAFKSPEDNNYLRCHPEQPTIFIIGTHLDMVPSAYLDGLHSVMVRKIDNMPYRNYIQYDPNERCFWAVDSTQAGKDEDNDEYLSRLRDLIIEESAMMKLSIPIPWLLLEELTANCKPLFAFNSLCEFAETKELVKNADEFKLMLRVFHVLGLFFHDVDTSEPQREQDDYVFVNPNALYTLTSKLFLRLKEKIEEYDQKHDEITITRQKINVLLKPTIEKMVKKGNLKDIFEIDPEWFIQLLCRLRLMATLGDDPHSQCIIPAILPYSSKSHPEVNPSVGSLLLTFVTSDRQFSYLPSGLFCGFIADVIRTQPRGLQWDPKELYRNLITFSLPFGILRIEEKKAFLKFDLTIKRHDDVHSITKNCQDLQEIIHERLREAWKGLYKQSSEEFEKIATWGVPCTYHKLPDDSDQDDPGHIAEYIRDPETGVFCAACLKPHSGLMQSVSRNEAVWFRDTEGAC